MRWALLAAAMLLLAGCTSPSDAPSDDPPQTGLVFQGAREDTDRDGRTDALNLTLVASSHPISRDSLEIRLDGDPLPLDGLNGTTWAPGTSIVLPCPDGVNEYEVRVDGRLVRMLVQECGTPPATLPPFFQARLIDGDGDGDEATIELELIGGGPLALDLLTARMGQRALPLYADALRSQLASGTITNGSQIYTACEPSETGLALTWGERELPEMTVRGCVAFEPGVDAPIEVAGVDLDRDGTVDGLNLTLGDGEDPPLEVEALDATWGNATAHLNGSTALTPPPTRWTVGQTLVATCPGDQETRFDLRLNGSLVLRRFVLCEAPPGQPLLDLGLDTTSGEEELNATLTLSRLGPLALENVTIEGEPVGQGEWTVGQAVSLPCPGGELVLRYEDRVAFRGASPC